MTADVPRHLSRTQGQRGVNVYRTHAAPSLGGSTPTARPVQNTTPTPTIYKPPVVAAPSNVVTGDSSGDHAIAIESTSPGTSTDTVASGSSGIAVGWGARIEALYGIGIGPDSKVDPGAESGIAIGRNARVEQPGGIAIGSGGSNTIAYGVNSVAIGSGATAFNDNEIMLGGGGQYVVPAALCLMDSAGNLHRLVVSTGGALSTVAYP